MIKQFLACGLAAIVFATGIAQADEASVKKAVEARLGQKARVDEVRKTGVLDLYEVREGSDLYYADENANYLFFGHIIDAKSRRNLTEERRKKLLQIKFSDLPLALAIKTVRGNGKRVFATFEDPNCGYCKKLATELVGMTDFTMYTFLYPILSPDSEEAAKAIWCAGDNDSRVKAWNDWMLRDTTLRSPNCNAPLSKITALGRKLSIRGTPAIILGNGERIPGFMPVVQLEKELNRVAAEK